MKTSTLLVAPALAVTAYAQSAPEFPVVVEENLPVTYEATNTEVTPPGILLPRDDVLDAPTVSLPEGADGNQTYIVFMIDQDVPRNGTKVNLLHWFQPDLHSALDSSALQVTMIDDNVPNVQGAEYIPPTPPGGSGAHRYNFFLYSQPDNFTVPAEFSSISPPQNTSQRIGFDLSSFVAAAQLGEPIAGNYLRVINGTEAETSSAATETGTVGVAPTASAAATTPTGTGGSSTDASMSEGPTSSPSVAPFEDGASLREPSGWNLLSGLALAALGAGLWMA